MRVCPAALRRSAVQRGRACRTACRGPPRCRCMQGLDHVRRAPARTPYSFRYGVPDSAPIRSQQRIVRSSPSDACRATRAGRTRLCRWRSASMRICADGDSRSVRWRAALASARPTNCVMRLQLAGFSCAGMARDSRRSGPNPRLESQPSRCGASLHGVTCGCSGRRLPDHSPPGPGSRPPPPERFSVNSKHPCPAFARRSARHGC